MKQREASRRRMIRESMPTSSWLWSGQFRVALAAAGLLAGSVLVSAPLVSQSPDSGTVAFLVQDGLRYAEQGRYSDAINVLEEAWERDPSNPIVAEHLALAYLYERIPPAAEASNRARVLMRFALEHGGQVTVLARHLHRGLRWAASADDHCSGRLVVSASGVHYRTTLTDHSFSLSRQQLESVFLPQNNQPSSAGGLTLRARDGKRQRIRTGTLSRSEARIVLQLIDEFLIN